VNGDGKLDLVTANNEDDDVLVLLGDGNGGFARAPGSPFPVGRSPYPIGLADVNGDGKLDVFAPNSRPVVRTVTILLGDEINLHTLCGAALAMMATAGKGQRHSSGWLTNRFDVRILPPLIGPR